MFDFNNQSVDMLPKMISSVTEGENDLIANLSNISSVIYQIVPNLNWAGFYRNINEELVLGPFQGKAACIRIKFGKGVCGTCAKEKRTILVHDVHKFEGHIACDSNSNSEIVIPLFNHDKTLFGVLDLDSPEIGNFDKLKSVLEESAKEIEKILP